MKRVIAKLPLVLTALALVASGCAAPKGQIRDSVEEAAVAKVLLVSGEELPDRVRLNIEGSTTLAYTVFRLSEPLRLIVDLADTDVTGLDAQVAVDLGNVSTVSPLQFDEAAGRIGRLEIALVELWEYETSRSENTIVIDFLKPVTVSQETSPPESEQTVAEVPQPVEVVELTVPDNRDGDPCPRTPAAGRVREQRSFRGSGGRTCCTVPCRRRRRELRDDGAIRSDTHCPGYPGCCQGVRSEPHTG